MDFSIVLIVKNEAGTIKKLTDSISEFISAGGDFLVVDTGSTDNTAEVARSLGARVEEVGDRFLTTVSKEIADEINAFFLLNGEEPILKEGDKSFHFADARNYAASLAKNDWCFCPDADEYLSKFDIKSIQETIKDGVLCRLEYPYVYAHDADGKPTISFNHSKFYRKSRMSWTGRVHETLYGDGETLFTDALKLEHSQNPHSDRSGYLTGLALDCFKNQNEDRLAHYFARELFYSGRYRSAIKEFERHISMDRWDAERSQSFIFMGDCWLALGFEEKALRYWHKAFTVYALRREPLLRLANYYWHKGDYQRVAAYANASLTIPQSGFYADNAADYRHIPHELLYWALYYLGDKEGAKFHFDKALEFEPNNPKFIEERKFFYKLD